MVGSKITTRVWNVCWSTGESSTAGIAAAAVSPSTMLRVFARWEILDRDLEVRNRPGWWLLQWHLSMQLPRYISKISGNEGTIDGEDRPTAEAARDEGYSKPAILPPWTHATTRRFLSLLSSSPCNYSANGPLSGKIRISING